MDLVPLDLHSVAHPLPVLARWRHVRDLSVLLQLHREENLLLRRSWLEELRARVQIDTYLLNAASALSINTVSSHPAGLNIH